MVFVRGCLLFLVFGVFVCVSCVAVYFRTYFWSYFVLFILVYFLYFCVSVFFVFCVSVSVLCVTFSFLLCVFCVRGILCFVFCISCFFSGFRRRHGGLDLCVRNKQFFRAAGRAISMSLISGTPLGVVMPEAVWSALLVSHFFTFPVPGLSS